MNAFNWRERPSEISESLQRTETAQRNALGNKRLKGVEPRRFHQFQLAVPANRLQLTRPTICGVECLPETDSPDGSSMTPTERQAEFNALFDALPGKNIEKIRRVCAILHLQENTVRLYRTKPPARTVPERSLRILRDALMNARI